MHLETLRLYCDVVRHRSFSRGATLNFVSQSAASQAMQQLEAELGVALLDRTKRPFVVTQEGRVFYDACRDLLESWDKAKAGVAAVKARVDGTVRVAAIYSVGLHDVSRHMQRFMSLRSEPMAFVCHPNHRLARRRLITPADLNGETFIAFDAGLTIRKAIDRALRQHNVRVNTVMEFDNIETIKQAIIIAAGVSILPRHTVQNEASIRTLTVVPLAIADLVRPVGLIHRRQKPLSPTVSRFIELLRDASEEPVRAASS